MLPEEVPSQTVMSGSCLLASLPHPIYSQESTLNYRQEHLFLRVGRDTRNESYEEITELRSPPPHHWQDAGPVSHAPEHPGEG